MRRWQARSTAGRQRRPAGRQSNRPMSWNASRRPTTSAYLLTACPLEGQTFNQSSDRFRLRVDRFRRPAGRPDLPASKTNKKNRPARAPNGNSHRSAYSLMSLPQPRTALNQSSDVLCSAVASQKRSPICSSISRLLENASPAHRPSPGGPIKPRSRQAPASVPRICSFSSGCSSPESRRSCYRRCGAHSAHQSHRNERVLGPRSGSPPQVEYSEKPRPRVVLTASGLRFAQPFQSPAHTATILPRFTGGPGRLLGSPDRETGLDRDRDEDPGRNRSRDLPGPNAV